MLSTDLLLKVFFDEFFVVVVAVVVAIFSISFLTLFYSLIFLDNIHSNIMLALWLQL